jgi:hypothetical protein
MARQPPVSAESIFAESIFNDERTARYEAVAYFRQALIVEVRAHDDTQRVMAKDFQKGRTTGNSSVFSQTHGAQNARWDTQPPLEPRQRILQDTALHAAFVSDRCPRRHQGIHHD